ncbi:lysophospholipid acyltransferase family protein [Lentisphaera profundi]|uniref:Lysophospholipid acyltransferase family protein n=1 Tax=Lentisphaera profundi TaxID=1658616 RepID=A0ABY7VR55_9BACT|nr:lysophospholipid acyltransferase family protein [Lentisphaera profundi]WDE95367.1 lysophospholipid acyltransferase family protein [Lentisphaera profundi]
MKFFLRIIYYIFSLFPDFVIYGVAKGVAFLLLYVFRFRRKIVQYNLDLVYGQNKWEASLLKEIYFHFGLTAVELLQQPVKSSEQLMEKVSSVNDEVYLEALKKGKGVLIMTGHYANWEKCILKIAELGNKVNVVIKDVKGLEKGYFSSTFREPHKINCWEKDGKVLLSIFRALKRGETVCMVMDQNSKRTEGCFVDFMGESCSTYASPLFVAAKTGAVVIPTTAYRNEDKLTQTVHFHDSMTFAKEEADEKSVQINTQKVTDYLSQALYDHPAYWIWMHKRWKTRPLIEKTEGLKVDYSGT